VHAYVCRSLVADSNNFDKICDHVNHSQC
jgi:hypothetical protein